MAQHDHQFHVKIPLTASIRFKEHLIGKEAPIFIESISDQFLVFNTHLPLPIVKDDESIVYIFNLLILDEAFEIEGVLLRAFPLNTNALHKFEAKFNISEKDRSRLFKLLNRYSIMVHKLKKEETSSTTTDKKSNGSRFSRLA